MKYRILQVAFAVLLALALGACHSSGSSSGDDDDDVTPSPTAAGEVIFTEIMALPDGFGDPMGEWFEVRNETAGDLNLQDCVFSDDASNFLVNAELIIAAGEYRTFSRAAAPGFIPDYVYNAGNILLNNTTDTVTMTCNGIAIAARTYPPSPVNGSSSALSDNGNGNWCDDTANVYTGGDTGTPGAANIDCPTPSPTAAGEVIFTEIMAFPDGFGDPMGEWFEVRNETAGDLNLQDCVFSDDASNFLVNTELIIAAGEYRTLSRAAAPGFIPDYVYNAGNILLNNTTDTVTMTCNGIAIDARTYPPSPVNGGSSALSNNGNGIWCDDLVNFYIGGDTGTPGAANIDC